MCIFACAGEIYIDPVGCGIGYLIPCEGGTAVTGCCSHIRRGGYSCEKVEFLLIGKLLNCLFFKLIHIYRNRSFFINDICCLFGDLLDIILNRCFFGLFCWLLCVSLNICLNGFFCLVGHLNCVCLNGNINVPGILGCLGSLLSHTGILSGDLCAVNGFSRNSFLRSRLYCCICGLTALLSDYLNGSLLGNLICECRDSHAHAYRESGNKCYCSLFSHSFPS